jgi:hypothetical protein
MVTAPVHHPMALHGDLMALAAYLTLFPDAERLAKGRAIIAECQRRTGVRQNATILSVCWEKLPDGCRCCLWVEDHVNACHTALAVLGEIAVARAAQKEAA